MKFKVGDRVKVKKCLSVGTYYGHPMFMSGMDGFRGMKAVITDVDDDGDYKLDMDHGLYFWSDDMLEPDTFTKADLKDGMMVEHRDGDLFIVLGDRIVAKNGYWTLDDYNDDLTDRNHKGADIVNVYKTKSDILNDIYDVYDKDYLELIWERKEEPDYTEMTVEEIEEKLGYKVKVIADK